MILLAKLVSLGADNARRALKLLGDEEAAKSRAGSGGQGKGPGEKVVNRAYAPGVYKYPEHWHDFLKDHKVGEKRDRQGTVFHEYQCKVCPHNPMNDSDDNAANSLYSHKSSSQRKNDRPIRQSMKCIAPHTAYRELQQIMTKE